jgi:hypothetical protein
MSAAEVIDKLKALLESERRAFARLYHELTERNALELSSPRAAVRWPDIEARQHAILGSRVLPENAVLAARREERW